MYFAPHWQPPGAHVVVFAAHPIGGELRPQPSEVVEIGYFDPSVLPQPLLLGQRRRIDDAVRGIGGSIVCLRDSVWPFAQTMTREDLYALRDQSGLSRQAFYLQFTQQATENDIVEVPGTSP